MGKIMGTEEASMGSGWPVLHRYERSLLVRVVSRVGRGGGESRKKRRITPQGVGLRKRE